MRGGDITGQKFGRLTVVGRSKKEGKGKSRWSCICECGIHVDILRDSLLSGKTRSCGCYRREATAVYSKKRAIHGETGTRLHRIWCGMKQRVLYKGGVGYEHYGGRGIGVCDSWNNSYVAFRNWALSHGYADNLTIDRINNDGNYEPDNCRWITYKTQENNRGNNRRITINGQCHTVAEWSRISGISAGVLHSRLKYRWPEEHMLLPANLNNKNIRLSMREAS